MAVIVTEYEGLVSWSMVASDFTVISSVGGVEAEVLVEIRLVRAAERVGEGVIVWIGGMDPADDAGGRVLIDSEGNGVVREYGRRVGRTTALSDTCSALWPEPNWSV